MQVSLTGASGMWSDFNTANRTAMMKSELFSWPVTMVILVLAFGSLVAAGLPLMLTILGLVASAGSLYLGTQLLDISIWAMNFALMFALALGIDYALFIVMRFRGALFGSQEPVEEAVAETMDTAGKAVLFSGVTVLISLTAVMLVPSPGVPVDGAGDHALGHLHPRRDADAAARGAGQARPARGQRSSLPWVHSGEHRSPRFAAWGERLWKRPLAFGALAVVVLVALALPVLGLKTGMPSIKVVPTSDSSRVGYTQVQQAFGQGAPGAIQIATTQRDAQRVTAIAKADPGVARVMPAMPGAGGAALVQADPQRRPVVQGRRRDRRPAALRAARRARWSAARWPRTTTSSSCCRPRRRWSSASCSRSASCCCSSRCRRRSSPPLGVLTNLLATGAAFGVARLIFQEGHGSGLLGFESQGFLDAWGPVFFFAMIFAISMDYTVFLLSSAKEHWDRSHDPQRGDGRRASRTPAASSSPPPR